MPRSRFSHALIAVLGLAAPSIAEGPKPAGEVAPPETFKADQRDHWAFQPMTRPDPPEVKDRAWVRNPIDRFIRSSQEEMGFRPAPEAGKVALIRRVTFDLTGLPPSLADVEAFLLDNRPDAYERLVDRLLASPRYGERWAQHWLDLAHYADSNGFELDAERPDAWRYRDWVVKAINDDMPYDRFVALQLAGDEVAPGDTSALIATGFGRCGPREVVAGNIDPEVRRQSELTEVTGTVGSVFLGLTMACARCHDHKFDALPTTDYYRLQSFFAGAKMVDKPIASAEEQKAFEEAEKAVAARVAPLKKRMADLEVPYRKALKDEKEASLTPAEKALLAVPEKDRTPAQKRMAAGLKNSLRVTWEDVAEAVAKNPKDHEVREGLKREVSAIEATLPRPPAKAMALIDEAKDAPESFVLKRGDVKKVKGPGVGATAAAGDRAGLAVPQGAFGRTARSQPPMPRLTRRLAPALASLDDPARQPAHGPRDGQPALDAPLWPGDRRLAQRLRRPRRGPDPPRAARLARDRTGGGGLAAQADPPADGHVVLVPPVVCAHARGACPGARRPRTPRTPSSGASPIVGSTPRGSATPCWPSPAS